jgi:hypothetical protein
VTANEYEPRPLTFEMLDAYFDDLATKAAIQDELLTLYGSGSIGTIERRGPSSGLMCSLTITRATWAVGLWRDAVGRMLDVRDPTATHWRNLDGPLVIDEVDIHRRALRVRAVSVADFTHCNDGDLLFVGPRSVEPQVRYR